MTFSQWFFAVAWLDVFKVVTELVVGLGWPAALVFIAITFRKEIRKKFDDIESAGPAGVTFRQQSQVQVVETDQELKIEVSENASVVQKALEATLIRDLKPIDDQQRIPILVHQLAVARLGRQFESIYSVIFGSQLEGLKRLRDNGGQTSLDQAEQFFERVKVEHPDFYASSSFTEWFQFLQRSELATLVGSSVSLTELGREFLVYVDETKVGRTRAF